MANPSNIQELQKRFGKPGAVRFFAGSNDLTCVELSTPAGVASVYLLGAHVTHYQPAGQRPVIWMSQHSFFEPNKAIRGGVPVILPWFGKMTDKPDAPQHGCARTVEWNFESVEERGSTIGVTLGLRSGPETRKWLPHDFEARFTVLLGLSLEMTLEMRNTSKQPFTFEEALHTYFSVADIRKVTVDGLDGVDYLSKVRDFKPFKQVGPITFAGETDFVYLNTTSTCTIHDPGLKRRIIIDKKQSASTVVWNPWIEKSKTMFDFGPDEWMGMLCVETCNIRDNAIALAPGQSHKMVATLHSQNE